MRRKLLFTIFKYLFFKICKLAKRRGHALNQILIKYDEKDVSANLYQNCLILCSKILLNVPHNFSLTVLLP